MGVPSFYRWLTNKFPNITVKAVESKQEYVDTSLQNPNGLEFDNLYLDMNGVIHPCFHPENHPSPPTTFEEVFNNIYEYIDRIFSIVRPRKLLFMAIDGVAPRAKMNQQRTRRFRTAKDIEIAEYEEEKLRKQFEIEGKQLLPKQESEVSDSNVITPGTEFMFILSKKLQDYIVSRMNNNPGWKNIKVILSDANVPGEGEHKIMSFIRQQRTCPDYNPNTRHCLYGLDADLIMLALATHEVHFSILREDVSPQVQQPNSLSFSQPSHYRIESSPVKSRGCGFRDVKAEGGCFNNDKTIAKTSSLIQKPYQFLHIWILRECLELAMKISEAPENFTFDLEHIIDDFIFLCLFLGNDFLPHMPTLEIHEGAMDLLMTVYKEQFKILGGHLVDMQKIGDRKHAYVKLKRVEKFILEIGRYEERIFKKRSELRERKLRRLWQNSEEQDSLFEADNLEPDIKNNSSIDGKAATCEDLILQNMKELKEKLKTCLQNKSDLFKSGGSWTDKVKLGTVGWRERYYKVKFSTESPSDMENIRKNIVQKYTEGLLWVLQYYFSGVPSWTWFYPYHYGPFASDFKGLSQVKVNFQKGSPFKPFDQLMGVLPPRSAHALPQAYQPLMTDETSKIIDLYPTGFDIDTDGKRFAWQGVCKLPFIDEERLSAETRNVENNLEKNEAERNARMVDKLFLRRSCVSETQISSLVSNLVHGIGKSKDLVKMNVSLSGIGGFSRLCVEDFCMVKSRDKSIQAQIQGRNILCVLLELPDGVRHIPRPLAGVSFPEKTTTETDIKETQLWHENHGNGETTRSRTSKFSADRVNNTHNPRFTSNSSSESIYKGAGSGWERAGKGGINTGQSFQTSFQGNKRALFSNPAIAASNAGSCWGSSQNFNKVQSVNSVNARGIECLAISEQRQDARSPGNSFWHSRNGTGDNTNNAWRQRLQFDADSSVENRRAQWSSTGVSNSVWKTSTRSRWSSTGVSNSVWMTTTGSSTNHQSRQVTDRGKSAAGSFVSGWNSKD